MEGAKNLALIRFYEQFDKQLIRKYSNLQIYENKFYTLLSIVM